MINVSLELHTLPSLSKIDANTLIGRSLVELVEQDVVNDPTLSRDENKVCEKCGEKGCVFFQAHGDDDDAMALIFMCINCKQKWIG